MSLYNISPKPLSHCLLLHPIKHHELDGYWLNNVYVPLCSSSLGRSFVGEAGLIVVRIFIKDHGLDADKDGENRRFARLPLGCCVAFVPGSKKRETHCLIYVNMEQSQ